MARAATITEDPAVRILTEQIATLDAELEGYSEKVQQRERAAQALAILTGRAPVPTSVASPRAPATRRRSGGSALSAEQLEQVVLTIRDNGSPMGAAALTETLGIEIKADRLAPLIEAGTLIKEGERRATAYRVA